MSSRRYWLWLASCPKLSPKARMAVLARYGDAEAAYFAPMGEYAKLEGVTPDEAKQLEKRELSTADRILSDCEKQNIQIISFEDEEYPKRLRHVYAPPLVLYVKGKLPAVDDEAVIAVIGTRRATQYGIRMAQKFGREISQCGGIVISGVTGGIDTEAVRGALEAGGSCIAVLGCSHDRSVSPLDRDIIEHGALLSEYPPATGTQRGFFRMRNRITAGLSVGVVVIEAPEKSGTRLFANEAAEQGKEMFAVPGNADAEMSIGTNELIKEGAIPVTNGWEVVREFYQLYPDKLREPGQPLQSITVQETEPEPEIREKKPPEPPKSVKKAVDKADNTIYIDLRKKLEGLSEEQLAILERLRGQSVHVDQIVAETGLKSSKVLAELTILQLKGLVRQESGKRFSAIL